MAAVWSDRARLGHWLEIEVLVAEAWARLGAIPEEDAREIRGRAAFDPERVEEVERVTRHDVAAFVQVVADSVGFDGNDTDARFYSNVYSGRRGYLGLTYSF